MIDNINYNTPPPSDRGFSFLTKERKILYSIILILFFTVVYSLFSNKNLQSSIENNKNKIELLQKQNDSISKENLDIRNKFITFENNIKVIDNKLQQNKDQIAKLKAETNEKINIINNMSVVELEQFFTNRYGKE